MSENHLFTNIYPIPNSSTPYPPTHPPRTHPPAYPSTRLPIHPPTHLPKSLPRQHLPPHHHLAPTAPCCQVLSLGRPGQG